MARKKVVIVSVVVGVVVAAGLATLIWWLVTRGGDPPRYETIPLDGEGFGNINTRAAFTRIPEGGDMFWWFYPTLADEPAGRPLVLWLDGVTGPPPSMEANFGMFGPFDFDLNMRNDSWINEYNLLFVDAPLGSGYSTILADSVVPATPADNTRHLLLALESFYEQHSEYADTPLYIFGQRYGAQLALSLALGLSDSEDVSANLKGVVLGNPIISPALALTKLGFYLEELGYIDGKGRAAVETFSENINDLVSQGQYGNAFDYFLSLGELVNQNAVMVNIDNIIDKLPNPTTTRDSSGQTNYIRHVTGFTNFDIGTFMNDTVAAALGISNANFHVWRQEIRQAFRDSFMVPATDQVERVLNDTDITVTIYNGNLDAVSNIPGQLEWVHNLHWSGQSDFLNSTRQTLIVDQLIQGYFQESARLTFYWINAAGLSIPVDSPAAIRRVLQRITAV